MKIVVARGYEEFTPLRVILRVIASARSHDTVFASSGASGEDPVGLGFCCKALRAGIEAGNIVRLDEHSQRPLPTLSVDKLDRFLRDDFRFDTAVLSRANWRQFARSVNVHMVFEESGKQIREASNKERSGSTGLDRNNVMRVFRFGVPGFSDRFWHKKFNKPSARLLTARTYKGRPSVSSKWNPLRVALFLLNEEKIYMTAAQLDVAIGEHLPHLLPEWKEQTRDHARRRSWQHRFRSK